MRPDEVLDKTADKYESGEWKWFQYGQGRQRNSLVPERCVSEALWDVSMSQPDRDAWFRRNMLVRDALRDVIPEPIIRWNDRPSQTKENVIAVLRHAAQLIRDRENV